jgi:hypothetical protein
MLVKNISFKLEGSITIVIDVIKKNLQVNVIIYIFWFSKGGELVVKQ